MTTTFKNYLENFDFDTLVSLWNTYGDPDSGIYDSVGEFCALFEPTPEEAARMVFFGEVENWFDKVYLDGYGNFKSCFSLESSPIDLDALAEAMETDRNEIWEAWAVEQEDDCEEE